MRRTSSAASPLAALVLAPLLIAIAGQPATAQGFLVIPHPGPHWRLPRPIPEPQPQPLRTSYRVASLEANARIRNGVATVQASQVFENTGPGQVEATFVFPLPYEGAVDQLTLMVDGKEFAGKILSREEARRRYEEIVRSSRDPALLEWVGQGMFQTSVFPIPPGAERTVTLRYTQVCRQSQGLADFLFPLAPAKYTSGKLDKVSIRVAIESADEIKSVYSPSHSVDVQRPDDKHAFVTLEAKDVLPTEDFRLFYRAAGGDLTASVVSYQPDPTEDGYFMVLATPTLAQPKEKRQAKTVLFVVDRSGSMSGEKMEQAREALKFVLNNLREGDTFNIVAYDSEVETFRPELEKFNASSRDAALGFVNGLFAGGTTNIDGALERALGMLRDDERPAYIIFLTDGVPTFGETNEAKIVARAVEANKVRARLFAFGVGYDLNSRLLDKLARAGHGLTEFVRPEENIESAVSSLYRRIGAPVMTDVELSVDVEGTREADGAPANRVYPRGAFDLFSGDQAVLVGRYRTSGAAKVRLRGKLAGKPETLDFPAELVADSDDDANAFVAKLWATRRVGEIIDQIDLEGRNDELVKELVELATRHGILTPYTSFLADDTARAFDASQAASSTGDRLDALAQTDGDYGFRQREAKAAMQMAAAPTSSRFAGGGMGGAMGGAAAPEAAAASGYAGPALAAGGADLLAERGGRGVTYYDAEADEQRVAQNVITVGRKTFFRRGERWVDSTVSDEEEQAAKPIERYSEEYFALVARHGKHVAAYLALNEPVVVKLEGRAYAW